MNQVSAKLRRVSGGYAIWCPACEEAHILPNGWTFDGNLEKPTFAPSFKHTLTPRVFVDGKWTGEWRRTPQGQVTTCICHYTLVAGVMHFHTDCTHAMRGKEVPLPTCLRVYRMANSTAEIVRRCVMSGWVEIPRGTRDSAAPCWIPQEFDGAPRRPKIKCQCGKICIISLHHVYENGTVTASFYDSKESTFVHNGRTYSHAPGCGWHVFLKLRDYDQGEFKPEE